jgi:hypothetical protein
MTSPLLPHARALLDSATAVAPAPWRADWTDDEGGDVDRILDADGDNVVIADSGVYPPRGPVAELIAAAPTLLSDLCTALEASEAEAGRLREALRVQHRINADAAQQLGDASKRAGDAERAERAAIAERDALSGQLTTAVRDARATAAGDIQRAEAERDELRHRAERAEEELAGAWKNHDAQVAAKKRLVVAVRNETESNTAERIAAWLDERCEHASGGVYECIADTAKLIRAGAWKRETT